MHRASRITHRGARTPSSSAESVVAKESYRSELALRRPESSAFQLFRISALQSFSLSALQLFGISEFRRFSDSRFNARQSRVATHKTSRDVRRFDALATEIPTPLNSATYAARQAGHLGNKTSVALETNHPAISPLRRHRSAGR
jgi:hypothetical protein